MSGLDEARSHLAGKIWKTATPIWISFLQHAELNTEFAAKRQYLSSHDAAWLESAGLW